MEQPRSERAGKDDGSFSFSLSLSLSLAIMWAGAVLIPNQTRWRGKHYVEGVRAWQRGKLAKNQPIPR